MQSYDQIQGFEYWNTEAWKSFVRDHILPLHNSTSKLLKLREFILMIVGNDGKVTLAEVERKRRDILPFLLGGINENGEYKDNSLARLVNITLGIYIDPKQLVSIEKEKNLRAFDYVTVKSYDVKFLSFLKKLDEITYLITNRIETESKEISTQEIEEIIQKPEKLLEILRTIYVKCLHVSVNHNYYTFFALSTQCLPYKYLIQAYPRLQSNLDSLRQFLGLKKIFEPKIDNKKIIEDYTVWGHEEGGLCDYLCKLNELIWDIFLNEDCKSVFNYISTSLKDLKQEFIQKIQQTLELIRWKYPTYITTYITSIWYGYDYIGTVYTITGPLLTKQIIRFKRRGYETHETHECNISLLGLLDDLAPALFFTYVRLRFSKDYDGDKLEIIKR